jgi:hypothetical protein
MKKIVCLLTVIMNLGILCSCETYVNRKKAEKIVKEWVNRTIVFPPVPCISVMQDTIIHSCINNNNNKLYKILLYVNAKGCESCKMQPNMWMQMIKEDSILSNVLSFEFYFHPKNEENLLHILKRERFDQFVHIDRNDTLNKLNKFSIDIDYQGFLLDKNNKVILVGNPFNNPHIWHLYKKIISEKTIIQ